MAQVAICPHCGQELLVSGELSVHEAMAKCPVCLGFFPMNEEMLRPLPRLLIVERASLATETQEVPPQAGHGTVSEWGTRLGNDSETSLANQTTAETVSVTAESSAECSVVSEGEQTWLESASAETSSKPLSSNSGEVPQTTVPSWEDTGRMEDLLAQLEPHPPEHSPEDDHLAGLLTSSVPAAEGVAEESWKLLSVSVRRGQRKQSRLRPLAMAALGGIVGLAAGYYCLLWLRGKSGDFLDLADYLPTMILPAEFRVVAKPMSKLDPAVPTSAPETKWQLSHVDEDSSEDSSELAADDQHTSMDVHAINSTPISEKSGKATDVTTGALSGTLQPAAYETSITMAPATTSAVHNHFLLAIVPSFTSEDLAEALAAARIAQPLLIIKGNLTDGRDVQLAKGRGYLALADLAQKLTFVAEAANSETLIAQRRAAEELLRETLSTTHTREEVARIFAKWLVSPNRRHGGVFFAANVVWRDRFGPLTEGLAQLDSGQTLTILAPAEMVERLGTVKQVAVAGWLLERPKEQIAGYGGESASVVWVGQLVSLER